MAADLCWLIKPDWLTIIVNVVIADAVIVVEAVAIDAISLVIL